MNYQEPSAMAASSSLLVFTKTATTPCMPVQKLLKGSYYLKLVFAPGLPLEALYLGKDGTDPTNGTVDLGSKTAVATVSADFWTHVRDAPQQVSVQVEYDPNTLAILEVYRC
jgi:hypothetical protein